MNTRILINDLRAQAEALAQDLRTLQENEKPARPEADLVLRRHQTGKWSVRVGEGAIPELYDAPEQALEAALDYFQVPLPQDRLRDTECINGSPCPGCGWCNIDIRTKCRNCGCELKEREKPPEKPAPEWTPRFKVGDRVRTKRGNVFTVDSLLDERMYSLVGSASVFDEDDLEPAPWTLSRHIPGFRPLEEGEQWHRDDFTEEMLPPGWRPLLFCEIYKAGDERKCLTSPDQWENVTLNVGIEYGPIHSHARTRRPLPDTERERFERWAAPLDLMDDNEEHWAWAAWQAARKA